MNYECLSRICKWLFGKLPRVLIGRIVLLWKNLTNWLLMVVMAINVLSCRTQQQTITSESSYHLQQRQSHYDSLRITDLTVIHDTISVLRTETIWREPDSVGRIYPLITINEERSAWRQTANNITSTSIDTVYVVNNTDDVATETVKITEDVRPLGDARQCVSTLVKILIAGIIAIIITIAAVIVVKLLWRFVVP